MPTQQFTLGKQCRLLVNGFELKGVRDVLVRRTTTEVDGTGYGHACRSSVVTHRTYELEVDAVSRSDANTLRNAAETETPVVVVTRDGFLQVNKRFTVHEISADETIDDAVVARFSLKEWGHPGG